MRYSLENLTQTEKQKVSYKLFGKKAGRRRYLGLVERCGGRRLGRGCFLVPKADAGEALSTLREHGVRHQTTEVYMCPAEDPVASFKRFYRSLQSCSRR
ncbi:TPA: hypothetical protein EYP44_02875 [Candidatus Bathyarchaeota archaeon]|nr:hypothetical protein [Candidatus Bathyarchaeota archaeon]